VSAASSFDPDAETVSSEHILAAMVDGVLPPSLEVRIETFCDRALREYQRFEALRPA